MDSSKRTRWTEAQAESRLRSLELFGMRFGLDRMRRMSTALGSPERSFDTIHVLGTNGKSSTTRMIAAILERHGLHVGAYLSPHLVSWRERVLLDGQELDADSFAAAVARASWAADHVNHTLVEGDHVTQFELLTAAALWEMARRRVDVAVMEAGLGGRYDATSVIESKITVLTNVGLEHTRWLGPTVTDIAEEKLAAVQPHAVLVLGGDLDPDALAVAERISRERPARIVRTHAGTLPAAGPSLRQGRQAGAHAPAGAGELEAGELGARGAFQRRNFALARAAAEAYLRAAGIPVSERAVAQAGARTRVPGRLQLVDAQPLTILDGAHNPHAVAALVASLPEVLPAQAPLALVLGVLEDKDAAAMLAQLLPVSARAWFTAPPSSRALSPAALHSLARQLRYENSECEPAPARALEQARRWALERGGAVLATGSVYLVGELLAGARQGAQLDGTAAAAWDLTPRQSLGG